MSTGLGLRGYYGDVVSGTLSGLVNSITAVSPERWTPIVAQITITSGNLLVMFSSGKNRFLIYDQSADVADQWSEFFSARSSVINNGGGSYTVTILPNGGWWTADFRLKFFASLELTGV